MDIIWAEFSIAIGVWDMGIRDWNDRTVLGWEKGAFVGTKLL